jgi:hypothetical protein
MATFQIVKLVATLVLDDKGFKDKANENKKSSENLFNSLKQGAVVLGTVAAAFAVAKKAFDFGKEGAQILKMEQGFNNWSKAIGTTSDALMNDLRAATRGMYSDAQLVESATNFMSLGLAKSHDEVVRLSRVAGALNMNMNQLVLTLTNKTTMRFDALGVKVDGFDEKVAHLKKTMNLSDEEAFMQGFLQQAEEQILITGDAADTAAGQFAIFEAEVQNSMNTMKVGVAEALLPAITWWNEAVGAQNRITDALKLANPELYRQYEITRIITPEMESVAASYIRAQEYGLAWGQVLADNNTALAAQNDLLTTYNFLNSEAVGLVGSVVTENERYRDTNETLRQKQIELNAEKLKLINQGYSPEGKAVQEVTDKMKENAKAMDENRAKHKEWVDAKVGELLLMKLSQDGLTDAEMDYYLQYMVNAELMTEEAVQTAGDIMDAADQQVAAFDETTEAIDHTESRLHNLMMRAQTARQQAATPIVYTVEINVHGSFPKPPSNTSPSVDPDASPNPDKPGRATGGSVFAGKSYDVVELNRPEVFTPNTSGRVDQKSDKPVIARIPREDMRELAAILTEEMAKRD